MLVVVDADQQVMRSNRVHNERRVHQYLGDAQVAIDPIHPVERSGLRRALARPFPDNSVAGEQRAVVCVQDALQPK